MHNLCRFCMVPWCPCDPYIQSSLSPGHSDYLHCCILSTWKPVLHRLEPFSKHILLLFSLQCCLSVYLFIALLLSFIRDEAELHKIFHGGAGGSHRCSFHQRRGGVWPCGVGAPKGHQSVLHEGAGKRGGHCPLAGGPRDEFSVQRLHLQDHILQEGTASHPRSVHSWIFIGSFITAE